MSTVMSIMSSDIEMLHGCCNLCGLSSISSGSDNRFLLCGKEQRDILNFLQCKEDKNDSDTSSHNNGDKEKDGSCDEVIMCNMCIKRIEVVSAMRKQVKFRANTHLT